MDIKNINLNIAVNSYKENISTFYNSKDVSSVTSIDKIELSPVAREMLITTETINEYIDIKKTDKIKKAIENGTYVIDSNKIAKKMLGIVKG
ncbi:flagellar biosynthesis anti-sigma factor FlgM [Metaclostridioides mangenotii]|uniref:flagellar biosynthesis anti-sigma factor FlgM n=1 Tax=Metaclostridioides mangenotii TaxID=1540 RepID=UPI000465EED5|nr:flagellar biosynthesis anti-sigma factor FlgM [Clostridioides mangenotii]